jgi:hypothetical protein
LAPLLLTTLWTWDTSTHQASPGLRQIVSPATVSSAPGSDWNGDMIAPLAHAVHAIEMGIYPFAGAKQSHAGMGDASAIAMIAGGDVVYDIDQLPHGWQLVFHEACQASADERDLAHLGIDHEPIVRAVAELGEHRRHIEPSAILTSGSHVSCSIRPRLTNASRRQ